ncbi:hypothetical protein D3C87_1659170 [compost metagenome]
MLQRHQPVADPVGGTFGGERGISLPLLDGLNGKTTVFKRATEIDMGSAKSGIELQAGAQGVDRTGKVVQLPERDRIIEIDEMQEWIAIVEGDPGLVDFRGLCLLPGSTSAFRNGEEIGEGEPLGARKFQNFGERGVGR